MSGVRREACQVVGVELYFFDLYVAEKLKIFMHTHWLRKIRPRWLRGEIFYRYYLKKTLPPELFRNQTLDFARGVLVDLLPTDVSHKCIAMCGYYGLPLSREITRMAVTGGRLVDVGANIGYYSMLWAAARVENRAIAFEVNPRALSFLERNINGNSLSPQIDIQKIAVGERSGKALFSLGPENQTGWGGFSPAREEACIEVPVISLDDFFRDDTRHVDLLKVDVEGADFWVLKGAVGLLRERRIKHIFFEENSVRSEILGIKPGEAQNFLERHGYRVRKISLLDYHAAP